MIKLPGAFEQGVDSILVSASGLQKTASWKFTLTSRRYLAGPGLVCASSISTPIPGCATLAQICPGPAGCRGRRAPLSSVQSSRPECRVQTVWFMGKITEARRFLASRRLCEAQLPRSPTLLRPGYIRCQRQFQMVELSGSIPNMPFRS